MLQRFNTPFLRLGKQLVNLEAISQVKLRPDGKAELLLQGPKKSLQSMLIPAPAGAELWNFVRENLVVVEFGEEAAPAETTPTAKKTKKKKPLSQGAGA